MASFHHSGLDFRNTYQINETANPPTPALLVLCQVADPGTCWDPAEILSCHIGAKLMRPFLGLIAPTYSPSQSPFVEKPLLYA